MAKEEKAEEGAEAAAPPKKSKKMLIIIILVVVVLIAGGAGAFLMMKKKAHSEDDNGAVATEKAKEQKKLVTLPVYVPIEAFTVNLIPETGEQFLQVIMSVEVADLKIGDSLKSYMPKLRNNVMLLLSNKKPSDLATKEGKVKLANEVREQMNHILAPDEKDPENMPVKEVLFTSFIIQ